jgi:hypothetical protein
MTVAELIARIMAAYPGATAEALKTFTPVFYARLRKHEGDALDSAATEVLGSFRAKYDQKFPIPADFEKELPSSHLRLPDAGSAIRDTLEQRRKGRQAFYAAWIAGQGAKIKAARPLPVYYACNIMARDLGRNLKPDEIERCIARALSAARVQKFGPLPKSNVALEDQYAEIRADWEKPQQQEAA